MVNYEEDKMKLFRELDTKEKAKFRKRARENYKPYAEIKGIWHPVVQAECLLMILEKEDEQNNR